MRTYLLVLVTLAVTAVWAVSSHPLLLVLLAMLTFTMLWSCDRDNRPKRDELAPRSPYQNVGGTYRWDGK